MTLYSKSVTEKLKSLQENWLSKLDTFVHGCTTKSMKGNNMSLSSIGAGVQGATGISTINTGAGLAYNSAQTQWQSHPMWDENNHQFNCNKVENGWTVQYRGKTFIASSLDDMMDQMKAAMVTERIEK